jgi:hypothetical protein
MHNYYLPRAYLNNIPHASTCPALSRARTSSPTADRNEIKNGDAAGATPKIIIYFF